MLREMQKSIVQDLNSGAESTTPQGSPFNNNNNHHVGFLRRFFLPFVSIIYRF